jgi:hypothetical protein
LRLPSRPVDREAAATWLSSRVGVWLLAFAGVWMLGGETAGAVPSYLSRWEQWDSHLFVEVARFGYRGYRTHTSDTHLEAFFPGEPLALRVVHAATQNWVVSGLLISAVAGLVAMVALGRLGELDSGATVGSRAVLYLTLSPYAVFLATGYSEALFLAFALPSWLAARRGRWVLAGGLAAPAAFVRIDGLFLGVALVVEWLTTGAGRAHAGRRRAAEAAALLGPWLVTAGFFLYLHAITGDWLAWNHAQREGWGRRFTAPWTAFHTSWDAATSPVQGAAYEWSFRAEIAAVLIGMLLTITLLVVRRWGEATYVGLQVVALATSSYYLSIARSTLLWFPLWLLLARLSLGRRWLHLSYLAVAPALMALGVVAFTTGHWVG